jgi:hypothetical protein
VAALIQPWQLPEQLMLAMKLLAFTLPYLVIHRNIDQELVVAAQLKILMMPVVLLM